MLDFNLQMKKIYFISQLARGNYEEILLKMILCSEFLLWLQARGFVTPILLILMF